MLVDAVNASVINNELCRGLLSHLGHSGHIVRTVAHKGLDVNKSFGSDLILPEDVSRVIVFYDCLALLRLGDPDAGVFCSDLQKVPVSREKGYFHPLRFRAPCQRSEDIIRFQTGLLADLYSHRNQYFFDQRDLFPQFGGHGFAGPLILFIYLMAECGRVDVKRHRQIIRFLLIQDLKENVQKAEHRAGMHTCRVSKVRHAVKCPVQYAVSVHEHKFLIIHPFLSFCCRTALLIKQYDKQHNNKGRCRQDLGSDRSHLDPLPFGKPFPLQVH